MAKKFVFFIFLSIIIVFLLQNHPISEMNIDTSNPSNIEENNIILKPAVKEDWSRIWNTSVWTEGHGVAVDEITGDVYVAGHNNTPTYDIVLIKYDSAGDQQWNITWDNGAEELAYDVAVDSEGYIYICGGNGTFGPTDTDMLLLKFNSSGKFEWLRTLDKGFNDGCWGITIDNNDDICIVADSVGDFFVVKYNKTGHKQWETEYDDLTVYASGRRIAHDNLNNIYVSGINNTNPNSDILLVKFDNLGNQIWNKTWVGEKLDEGTGVAIDSNYNIYVSGIFNNTISSTGYDLILIKFDNNGNFIWNRTWGTDYDERRTESAVAVDSKDSVYITGGLSNDLTALLKYSSSGKLLWNITYNASVIGSYPNHLHDIYIDHSDNIYITGYVWDATENNYDIFLAKFLPDSGLTSGGGGDDDDDDDDDDETVIPGYNISYILGTLAVITIVLYKKGLGNSK
jgi:hypothetical protein